MHRVRHLAAHVSARGSDAEPSGPRASACASQSEGILAGLRVVELATVIAGPTCAALMADMGADVIKVEEPAGDSWRTSLSVNPKKGVDYRGEKFSSAFENANRGKRSAVIDLKTADGKAAMQKLIATSDIFLTNVRLQALKKLGFDYDTLKASLPKLIFAHLTAWGRGGPKEGDPGYDVGAFWAATGMQKFVMADDEPGTGAPRFVGAIGDHVTAIHLLTGCLGALLHRHKTGEGQYVEACLYRAGVHAMAVPMIMALVGQSTGNPYKMIPRILNPNPTYQVVRCRDGKWVQLLGLETLRHLAKLLETIGIADAIQADSRFAPVGKNYRDLLSKVAKDEKARIAFNSAIDDAIAQKDFAEWERIFTAADVWHQCMEDVNDVACAPNAEAVGSYVDVPGVGHKLLAHPIKWSATPVAPRGRAPDLGAHTSEIMEELRRQ